MCIRDREDPDAAAVDRGDFGRDLVVNVAGGELRLKGDRILALVEPALDTALALAEPKSENGIHLKSFCESGVGCPDNTPNTANHRRISGFLKKSTRKGENPSLVQGLVRSASW